MDGLALVHILERVQCVEVANDTFRSYRTEWDTGKASNVSLRSSYQPRDSKSTQQETATTH